MQPRRYVVEQNGVPANAIANLAMSKTARKAKFHLETGVLVFPTGTNLNIPFLVGKIETELGVSINPAPPLRTQGSHR